MAITNSLKNELYATIKERIVECEYAPGSILNEKQLADELGTSRTPIREVISKLEMEGLVQILPKKGIYVSDITFADILQVFQTRVEIEPIALRLSAPRLPKDILNDFCLKFNEPMDDITNSFRLDTAMHLFIIENCGNRYIIDMMHRVFEQNTRIIISSKQNQLQIHDAKQEHLDILNLLYQDQYAEAEKKMRHHIQTCRQAALDFYCNNQMYYSTSSVYQKELNKIE